MTRIIAGFAGSLGIATPGSATRPTSDRVREAIFSGLDARGALPGARVLDLYAGSGALGLEAASRGAQSVVLVEKDSAAIRVCRRNAALVLKNVPAGHQVTIDVRQQSVQAFLDAAGTSWDLALLDPPYDLPESALARDLSSLAAHLSPEAVVVVERSSRSPEPSWPDRMRRDRRKDYGDTTVWWATG